MEKPKADPINRTFVRNGDLSPPFPCLFPSGDSSPGLLNSPLKPEVESRGAPFTPSRPKGLAQPGRGQQGADGAVKDGPLAGAAVPICSPFGQPLYP